MDMSVMMPRRNLESLKATWMFELQNEAWKQRSEVNRLSATYRNLPLVPGVWKPIIATRVMMALGMTRLKTKTST